MLDKKLLKAEMVKNGFTQEKLAKVIGVTPRTFTNRLKTGDFGSKEIEVMINVLRLDDPMSIFFADKVT